MRHQERHRIQSIGWLRAAVLGANDGIISTSSLILGSSRFSGKCILDLQEEVCRVPEAVSHPLDDFDLIVHTFQNR